MRRILFVMALPPLLASCTAASGTPGDDMCSRIAEQFEACDSPLPARFSAECAADPEPFAFVLEVDCSLKGDISFGEYLAELAGGFPSYLGEIASGFPAYLAELGEGIGDSIDPYLPLGTPEGEVCLWNFACEYGLSCAPSEIQERRDFGVTHVFVTTRRCSARPARYCDVKEGTTPDADDCGSGSSCIPLEASTYSEVGECRSE